MKSLIALLLVCCIAMTMALPAYWGGYWGDNHYHRPPGDRNKDGVDDYTDLNLDGKPDTYRGYYGYGYPGYYGYRYPYRAGYYGYHY